jgi:PadR family transcriptional regulator, regulatory protein AphA
MLCYALLGFLGYSPMTGYDLKQRMDRSTAHFWHAKLSQIYTTLKGLEKDGWVASTLQEQADRPDRRVYTITPLGQREFYAWLAEPYSEISPKKETLVLKMFFSARQDKQLTLRQLHIQLDLHQKQLTYYRMNTAGNIQAALNEFPQLLEDAQMWEATRRFGEMVEIVYVQWIEEMIQEIK